MKLIAFATSSSQKVQTFGSSIQPREMHLSHCYYNIQPKEHLFITLLQTPFPYKILPEVYFE
jgi:hypothetical protein